MTKNYLLIFASRRIISFVILTCIILFTLGCNLFSTNYWVHRLDGNIAEEPNAVVPTIAADQTNLENGSAFASKCLNSSGDSPCPIEACVVFPGEYTVKNVVTTELFGKANPNDYACCADFQFTNNSGVDLMGFEHTISDSGDSWLTRLYPLNDSRSQEFLFQLLYPQRWTGNSSQRGDRDRGLIRQSALRLDPSG